MTTLSPAVELLVMEKFGIEGWQAREVAEAVRLADPDISASDLEIAILWDKMSDDSCVSWFIADEHRVESFLIFYGQELRTELAQSA